MSVLLPLKERPYRPCVGIMLINQDNRIFAGQRIDTKLEAWQMPQGGIDEGETPLEAAFREMKEETGTDKARLLAEHSDWLDYDIPQPLADKLWDGAFRGQTQKWIAMRFTGTDADINIATEHPEFNQWRWVDPEKLVQMAVPFKQPVYAAVMDEFAPLLLTSV